MNSVFTRVLIGIIGIPGILALLYFGKIPFLVFVCVVGVIAQWEFYRMIENKGFKPYRIMGTGIGFFWILATYFFPQFLLELLLGISLLLFLMNLRYDVIGATERLSATITGFVYIPLFWSTTLLLRKLPETWGYSNTDGFRLLLLLCVSIWVCDTFAYLFGSLFGKKKIAPNISPNKSWIGSISGLLGAVAVGILFQSLKLTPEFFSFNLAILFTLIVGIVGQLGDLTESVFKRDTGVKDSGTILMGHGGVMDRFDAFFLASPFIYLFMLIAHHI